MNIIVVEVVVRGMYGTVCSGVLWCVVVRCIVLWRGVVCCAVVWRGVL